ncbi:MAG: imidazole glycerol phosphate synthase subunit HisF [Armatimonadetes bacterium]|nr:MAG: imidazole glycerol phosphate synthase subunit HisF [Armatimonadota bacterium]
MPSLRIIPCLDVKDGRVVKGVQFLQLRDQGDPVELGRRYWEEGADELVYLDITASHERRRTTVELAHRVAQQLFIPFTVGGGIASVEEAAEVLAQGADKVAINTAALNRPQLITDIAERFGSQAVVVAIDARRREGGAGWDVFAEGGRRRTDREAVEWAREAVERGAGELLVTSMDRDGTTQGYDTELLAAIAEAASVPLIASGGAGAPEHLVEAARSGADGLLVASIVHEGVVSIRQLKQALAEAGFPVRF